MYMFTKQIICACLKAMCHGSLKTGELSILIQNVFNNITNKYIYKYITLLVNNKWLRATGGKKQRKGVEQTS